MSPNVLGISEVPSEARNLDEALAKSDMHLLGVGVSPEVSESKRRVVDRGCPSQIIKGAVQSWF